MMIIDFIQFSNSVKEDVIHLCKYLHWDFNEGGGEDLQILLCLDVGYLLLYIKCSK